LSPKRKAFVEYLNRNIICWNEYRNYTPIYYLLDDVHWAENRFPRYYETIIRKIHESTEMSFFIKHPLFLKNARHNIPVSIFICNNDIKWFQALIKTGNLIGFEKSLVLFKSRKVE